MRKLVPIVLRPWTLPLIVIGLVAPSIAAFALVGPQLGLAVGALIVLAARAGYDEPIEVAPRRDRRFRMLVVAGEPISEPEDIEQIAAIAVEGDRALGSGGAEPEVLVLAPATQSRLDRWASDVGKARDRASSVLAVSLGTLTAAGLDVRGRVGDADAVQAIEDERTKLNARPRSTNPGGEGDRARRPPRRAFALAAGAPAPARPPGSAPRKA